MVYQCLSYSLVTWKNYMFIMVVSQASDPPLACRGLRAKSRVCRVQQRPRDTMRRADTVGLVSGKHVGHSLW